MDHQPAPPGSAPPLPAHPAEPASAGYPPPPPGYYAPPMGPPGEKPWNGKTNGFAIACLTLSLFGCVGLLSIVFGIIALRQTSRNGDRRGRTFAIAGLGICTLWLSVIAGAVIVNLADGPDRDPAGGVRGERSLSTDDLRAGDCLKDLLKEEGQYVDVVPCGEPHADEVFARYDLPPGAWPGGTKAKESAQAGCDTRFAEYTGSKAADAKGIFVFAAPPAETDWPKDRGVLCLAHYLDDPVTGSLRR